MKSRLEQSGHIGVITLEGELTKKHKTALITLIMKTYYNADTIILDLSKVTAIDHACSELLWSACQTIKYLNKTVKITGSGVELLNYDLADIAS